MKALQLAEIQLCFLPAYLPELDAAEFVFYEIKRKVKKHKNEKEILWVNTMVACAEA